MARTRTRKNKKLKEGGMFGRSHDYVDLTDLKEGDQLHFDVTNPDFQDQINSILDDVLKRLVNIRKNAGLSKSRYYVETIKALENFISIFSLYESYNEEGKKGQLIVVRIPQGRSDYNNVRHIYIKKTSPNSEEKEDEEEKERIDLDDDQPNKKSYIDFFDSSNSNDYPIRKLKLYGSFVKVIKKEEIEGGKKNTTTRKKRKYRKR